MKGYADQCPYCLSRRRRRQPKKRHEHVDRRSWAIGEKWTMDFTAMCLKSSWDLNRVGILFEENETDMLVGQTLQNHTFICDALDWLKNYVRTERRGVQLRCLYADCDPIWFSTDELRMFLRKVGRWCFVNGVALSTNVPGQSQQNGVIEGSMNQVMALTSVQLQCSFLNELFWDRSFMLAIFILARRYRKNSKSIHLRNSWHKSSYTAWSGLLFDISILICAFGQALILKNDKKSNQYKRQGELALFMGIPANSKGWLVWNVPRQKYQVRYNIRVIKDMMMRPARLCINNQLQPTGPMVPDDSDLMGKNVLGILQNFNPSGCGEDYNEAVIAFSSVTGQPVKVVSIMNIEDDQLESYYVQGEELPDDFDGGEGNGHDTVSDAVDDHDGNEIGKNNDDVGDQVIADEEQIDDADKNLFGNPDDQHEDLMLFEKDDGFSLEDPRKGLNQTGIFKKVVLNPAEKRWFSRLWKNDNNIVKFQSANPKKPPLPGKRPSLTYQRYDLYKHAKNIGEMKKATGTREDLIYAFCRGQVTIPKMPAVRLLKKFSPILRAMMRSSTASIAAREIAEATHAYSGMSRVLKARVHRVDNNAAVPDEKPQGIKVSMEYADGVNWNNPLEEKIKVYNNTDYDFEVDGSGERMVIDANGVREDTSSKEGLSSGAEDVSSKEGLSPGSEDPLLKELIGALDIESNDKIEKVKEILKQLEEQKKLKGKKSGDKHLTKKARAARKAAGKEEEQEEEVSDDELTWEDKDIMKGLGIHDTQHVSSSVSVKEMISRASAKVCQVLQDIENHLRTKEGRPARAHVDHLSRSAMNAVLDPRNDECFNKSLAFKELFHVYAAKAIRVKDVIKNATTNGWCDPMKAEWKRILIDFPCLEAISELPQGKKWVPLLWVLVQKKNSMGTDTRKKARIVACQTLEKFWYEKDEKISPTVNPDAVKIMCGLCLQLDMTMETRDQAGGYLHAEYPDDEEPVYVRVPDHLDSILKDSPELVPKTPDGRVAKFFRVRRALYGCQLSCRIFYQMFRDFMVGSATVPQKDGHRGAGWTQSEIDPCVFFKKEGKGFAILCCHVDDSLIIATKDEDGQRIRQEFSDAFASRFEVSPECTDGDVHEYLSMLITIDRRAGTLTFQMPKLFIKLKALLESMGDRAKKRGKYCRKEIYVRGEPMNVSSKGLDQKKVRTPMALDNKDIYAESSEENPIVPYDVFDSRRILGLAAYIILGIRPDAAHAAAIVARFTGSKQTEAVIKHTVRLAWYLVDTEKDYVLTFRKSLDGLSLSGMVDASFANDPKTKRSYFGYVLRHGANPIAWRSKLEASVALSTRDAELMAAVHSVQHILGIRFFLSELGLLKEGATSVMTDNKASMEGVQNDKNHKGSHYMGYRLSWLREQVADLLVHFEHVESKKNVADIFTKVLCEDDFVKLRSELLNLEELVS